MQGYAKVVHRGSLPRLASEGSIDLTYRCNNDCLHCWVRRPPAAEERLTELRFDEIRGIVDEARRLGCREWCISGGEPMLRPDFSDIFEYITAKCQWYILNTNGTLITPRIAKLLTRRGSKLVALYGATEEVHDRVTRNPGSYQMTLRGMAYLREAGAPFVVQVIPMQANYHEYDRMLELGRTLSPHMRIGAAWLYLPGPGDEARRQMILAQRLPPEKVQEIDPSDGTLNDVESPATSPCGRSGCDDRLFARCIDHGCRFHVDAQGTMSFCSFVKDPDLRYDLRKGSLEDGWERFLPALAEKIRGGAEYRENCGACEYRKHCRWCPVFGYLEHGRYSARVDYLCSAARHAARSQEDWIRTHRRYYRAAGITVRIDSDIPFEPGTLDAKFRDFETDGAGEDTVTIRHHFALPPLEGWSLGKRVYDSSPWKIYRRGTSWIYFCGVSSDDLASARMIAVFNNDYSRARIYHRDDRVFRRGGATSLTFFSSDQILMAQLLARREGCFLHSSGVILNGWGLLFTGHSETGKSTMMKQTAGRAEWLTDDRMILRRWDDGFRIHGTWSHGELPQVSAASAPLGAILFLEKADGNRLVPITDKTEVTRRLLGCLIKPLETAEWWTSALAFVARIAAEAPCYRLEFDLRGGAVTTLERHFAIPPAGKAKAKR